MGSRTAGDLVAAVFDPCFGSQKLNANELTPLIISLFYWSDDHIPVKIVGEMSERVVSATEFKAKCLALLDEMEKRGETITITRRGRPVAVLGPVKRNAWKSPKDSWAGKARIVGDIVSAGNSETWDVLRRE